jgi:hypothetical protein
MKLKRASRAPQSETIIALIDVVFFLLVFFMLIGRMDATAPFDVAPPQAQTGRDMPAGGVTLAISKQGSLALDASLRLRINAHRDADLRHVLPYVSQAETLGIRDVILVVTPERAPQTGSHP